MRSARKYLSSEYMHVTHRGLGRRIIFEDETDRRQYLSFLKEKLKGADGSVLSWCIMNNHVHLLTRMNQYNLSKLMQRVGISYAQYFNGRHGHVGKVFQGRFTSSSIRDDSHLLATIKYIHKNPERAGICYMQQYSWSSYREITNYEGLLEGEGICDVPFMLSLFGSLDEFERFHAIPDDNNGEINITISSKTISRITDEEAQSIAIDKYGLRFSDKISTMSKNNRDSALRTLKSHGLSVRQIERLTGIGRNIVDRA